MLRHGPTHQERRVTKTMISLKNVTKRFHNSGPPAVSDLYMDVENGETVVLVGA
jgi:ABC-type sugar transport system ATPase subunit